MKAASIAGTLLALALPARAEPVGAELRARIGSVEAPFYTTAQPMVTSESQAYALVLSAWYDLAPSWRGGVRLAAATSSIEEPGGSYTAAYTIGNPILYAEHGRSVAGFRIGARASLGLPLAGHGPEASLVRNRVLAASDALEGWRDPELYRPGVLPLALEAEAARIRSHWRARVALKLPVLVRVSDAGLPAEARVRALGLQPILTVDAAWRPRTWLSVGLAVHAVALARAQIDPVRDVGRSGALHVGVAPHVALELRRLTLGLELLAAAAGPLAGTAGLGLTVAWPR
jgi:hypothetical protein